MYRQKNWFRNKTITSGQLPGEKQETILPLVHQVWQPLHLLFKSNNIFVVEKAFRCLRVIGEHARDFVHKRTVTDVLPPLLTFFKSLGKELNKYE